MKENVVPPTSRDVIIESGSDAGKHFVVSMMSAYSGDRWARKLAAAAARGAAQLPSAVMAGGPAAFAGMTIAVFGQIEDDTREALFDELLKCVKIKRGDAPLPSNVIEYDFTDPFTLTRVREEAFELNVNFIRAAVSQLSPLAAAAGFLGTMMLQQAAEPAPPT